MRTVILKAHLVVALVAGAFLVVLGATGAVMAFEEPLQVLSHPELYRIPPGAGAPLPIAALETAVTARYPGERILGVFPPPRPDRATIVQTSRHPVFVNGFTGEVLGALDSLGFLGVVHQVHLRLIPGLRSPAIHAAIGSASIALFLLVVSGAFLWWRGKRFTFRSGPGAFRKAFDLHAAAGLWSGFFLLVASLTGAVLAWDAPIVQRLYAATGTKPAPRTAPSTPREGAVDLSPERVLEIARAALPGAEPILVMFPQKPTDAFDVRMHFPEDRTPGGRSWVSVDRASGEVLVRESSRTAAAPARALTLVRALHTGDVAGTPSRVAMSLASLVLVLQTLSGLVIWWKRPKSRAQEIPGA